MPDYQVERIPPNNLDAERAVLGASFLDKEALMYVVESLQPDDFYEPRHGIAFEIMRDMAARDRAVDSLTFADELTRRGTAERLGGHAFIAMLVDSVTTTANVEHHCSIVRDKSIHRQLIRVGADITKTGFSEEIESADALTLAEQQVFELARHGSKSQFRDISSVVLGTFEQIEKNIAEGMTASGIASGFADLDRLTGGFQPGSLNIVAARPSVGKTAFALNIAQFAAMEKEVPVLIFSLEMPAEQLAARMLSAEAEVNLKELQLTRKVRNDQWTSLTNAVAKLSRAPIYIDDSSMLTTLDLRSRCRRFFSKHNQRAALVIVDYLQLMETHSKRTDNRQQEVSDISRALKGVAREFEVPVIALSQLSREVEKRGKDKRPVLSDLRDSGAIEQDADLVAFLYRHDYQEAGQSASESTIDISVAKHRNGEIGDIKLIFYKEYSKFGSFSRRPDHY